MNFSEQEIKKNHIKRSFLSWGLLALLVAVLAVGANAQSYPCTNAIYFTSSDNTNVYRYTPSTNAITQLSGVTINYGSTTSGSAGAALTPDGSRLYFNDRISPRQLRYNVGKTSNPIAALQSDNSGNVQRNGISPNGTGYFMIGVAGSGAYYRYTTGGTTSTVTSGTLTVQPATAPALGTGGDITFDSNGIGYLLDQAKNFYRLDFTNNVANYIGTVSGMGTDNPNGLGFSQKTDGTYELYASTITTNLLYRINLATMAATVVTPSSTVTGFTQNDIASCIYPPNITPKFITRFSASS
jgi:sugar lactone lactonase YvrE